MTEREQLRQSIATLEAQRPVLGDAVVEPALAALREKLAALEAQEQQTQQRKLATILFMDIAGHTEIVRDLDPEANMALIDAALTRLAKPVYDHGGHVARYQGDGFKAAFGLPVAHENDPENAVRAALAIQEVAHRIASEWADVHDIDTFRVRVGLDTGLVVAGGLTEGEDTIKGMPVNLAARLESAAQPGSILISHNTYRHIRGVFDVQPQELIAVKGVNEPVRTYRVQRAKPRAFRMATRGVEGIETRMIGREAEMLALQSAYADAIESAETRVVTVIGEAGVGKSRLLYEFDNWIELRPEQVYYFKGRGTPITRNVPNSLFRDLFAFRFEILDSDPTAVALQKFQEGMMPIIEPDQAAVAGHWLGFDFSASEAVSRLLGGSGFAETARAHLTRYFRKLAAAEPVVIFLEDIHWADDQSLDLATYLAQAMPAAYLLVVTVARPSLFERRPNWGEGEAAFRKVILAPLSKRASQALVGEILQRIDDIPAGLRDLIVDAAEGNPFYVEELVKMLIDQGVIERGITNYELGIRNEEGEGSSSRRTTGVVTRNSSLESWRVREERLEGLKVPPTLTGLLQARLDGLPRPEREALQRASVVGRLFWDDCVAELLETNREAVDPALQAVRGRELIFRREHSSFAGTGEYIFKHALLRDVAYETVLLKHRATFHGRVARWLEENARERLNEYLTLIAEHYIQAGDGLKAAGLLEKSGYEAIAVGASSAARAALERALSLREAAGETEGPAATRATIALGWVLRFVGDFEAALEALTRGLAGARRDGDRGAEAEALARLARVLDDLGRYDEAGALVEAALEVGRVDAAAPMILILNAGAVHAQNTGDLNQADSLAAESLEQARAVEDATGETIALNTLGANAALRGDLPGAALYFEAALAVARRSGNLSQEAMLLGNLGYTAYRRGDYAAARAYALEALARHKDLGEKWGMVVDLANLAQADFGLGDLPAARRGMREMLSLARSLGMTPSTLWGLSLAGQILAAESHPDRALTLFGLARAHPALNHESKLELEEEIARMGLPEAEVEAGLAAGATLDFDTVVQEILDGRW
jgi:predicted ATPase/class 3 adenylate cyclase